MNGHWQNSLFVLTNSFQYFGDQATQLNATQKFFLKSTTSKGLAPILRDFICLVYILCATSEHRVPFLIAQGHSTQHQRAFSLHAGISFWLLSLQSAPGLWMSWCREKNVDFRDSQTNLSSSSSAGICDVLTSSDSLFLFSSVKQKQSYYSHHRITARPE